MFINITMTGADNTTTPAWVPCGNLYCSNWPSVDDLSLIDDRHNRKAWALWFREFLQGLLGAGRAAIKEARQRHPLLIAVQVRCRSATLSIREWKMKLWKQSLEAV